jgi:hypothetical protein
VNSLIRPYCIEHNCQVVVEQVNCAPPSQKKKLSRKRIRRNLLTYLLTPWCRILFEKLSSSLSKNILLSLWNPRVHYRVHKNPPLDPILSQLNPVRPIDPHFPKAQLNVILPPTPRSFQWSLTFGPPNQNPVNTSPLPHARHMSRPPHPP